MKNVKNPIVFSLFLQTFYNIIVKSIWRMPHCCFRNLLFPMTLINYGSVISSFPLVMVRKRWRRSLIYSYISLLPGKELGYTLSNELNLSPILLAPKKTHRVRAEKLFPWSRNSTRFGDKKACVLFSLSFWFHLIFIRNGI